VSEDILPTSMELCTRFWTRRLTASQPHPFGNPGENLAGQGEPPSYHVPGTQIEVPPHSSPRSGVKLPADGSTDTSRDNALLTSRFRNGSYPVMTGKTRPIYVGLTDGWVVTAVHLETLSARAQSVACWSR
jgi:hypothetical protein